MLTAADLLGVLGHITGVPFDPDAVPPSRCPVLFIEAVERIQAMPNRSETMTAWLDEAMKMLPIMRRMLALVPLPTNSRNGLSI